MHTKIKTFGLLSAFLLSMVALLGTSASGAGTAPATISPSAGAFDPYQDVLGHFFSGADSIEGFTKAAINTTNIYYKTTNATGSRSFPVAFSEAGTWTSNTASITAFFSGWYNNYTALNASLVAGTAALAGHAFGGASAAWTEQAWKETVATEWHVVVSMYNGTAVNTSSFNSFVAGIEDRFAAVNPVAHGLPAFRIGTTWANATPEEVYMVINAAIAPRGTFWTTQFMYRHHHAVSELTGTTVTAIVAHAIEVMEPARIELAGQTSLEIDYALNVDVNIQVNVDNKGVFVLWDHDDSVRRFIEAITPPITRPDTKLFTGDEMLYLVHFTRVQTTITGDVVGSVTWTYNDDTPATAFKNALQAITRHPHAAQLIARAAGMPVQVLRAMFLRDVNVTGGSVTRTQSSFSMAQLKVNDITFEYRRGQGIQVTNIDLWYADHKMAGLLAYEDVNGNGIHDLSIHGSAPFLYPVSNESRYKYQIERVESINFTAPAVVDNELVFGIAFNDIQGSFVPHDISDDVTMLNDSVDGSVPSNVSTIAFDFRFGVRTAQNEARMKVDYIFGNFTHDGELDGLGLSMISMFTAYRFQYGSAVRQGTQLGLDNGTGLDTAANDTREIGRVRFASGTSLNSRIFEMDLASIPYQIGGVDYNATAQFIPARAAQVSWGRATLAGNATRLEGAQLTRVVMLYSVNFPTWSGEAIVHDPVFSTFIPSEGGRGGLGLIIGIVIAGIAALVVIVGVVARKRRAAPFPYPGSRAGGDKARAGMLSSKVLDAFLFSLPGDEHVGTTTTRQDAFTPGTFEFLASMVSVIIMVFDHATGEWTRAPPLTFDQHDEHLARTLATMMLGATFVSGTHVPVQERGVKGYLYEISMPGSTKVFLLDGFARIDAWSSIRVSCVSRSSLGKQGIPVVQAMLRDALHPVRRNAPGKVDMGALVSRVCRHLQVHLSMPRLFPSTVDAWLRRAVLDDPLLSLADRDEIFQDLAGLGPGKASKVMESCKDDADAVARLHHDDTGS